MKKIWKIFTVLTVISALFITCTVSVFAQTGISVETSNGNISVMALNNNSVYMSDGDTFAVMRVNETKQEIKYEIVKGEEIDFLIYDKNTNKMTSSITGQSISMDDILVTDDTSSSKETSGTIIPMAVGDVVESHTFKISYAQIAALVGDSYSKYDLAYTIVAIMWVFQGVAITTIVSLIYGALKGELLNRIVDGVKNNAPGGIKITIDKVEIRKHQGGKMVKGYGYKVGTLTTYS